MKDVQFIMKIKFVEKPNSNICSYFGSSKMNNVKKEINLNWLKLELLRTNNQYIKSHLITVRKTYYMRKT